RRLRQKLRVPSGGQGHHRLAGGDPLRRPQRGPDHHRASSGRGTGRKGDRTMSMIVQKFGGTSVRDAERLRNVAEIVTDTYQQGNDVVVVVSAQGDTTDDLIAKAEEVNPRASKREMDMLLSSGEQISAALLAMTIEGM